MDDSGKKWTLKQFCYAFATLGSLGEWRLGSVVASAFAVPMIFLFRSVYWFSHSIFYWLLVVSIVVCIFIIQCALQAEPEKARCAIVLDKIIGVMVALTGISLRWRVVIFGLILFHILNTLKPFGWYKKIVRYIELMPGVVGILGAEILSGVLVNVFLRLIAWVMG